MSFTSETQSRSAFRVDQRFANTSVIGQRGAGRRAVQVRADCRGVLNHRCIDTLLKCLKGLVN